MMVSFIRETYLKHSEDRSIEDFVNCNITPFRCRDQRSLIRAYSVLFQAYKLNKGSLVRMQTVSIRDNYCLHFRGTNINLNDSNTPA